MKVEQMPVGKPLRWTLLRTTCGSMIIAEKSSFYSHLGMTASSDSVQNQERRTIIYLPTSAFHHSEGCTIKRVIFPAFFQLYLSHSC